MVSEWCEHRDRPVAPIRQRTDAELVDDVYSIGYCKKQPIGVVFIDTLREERDDAKKRLSLGA